ncbi:hypothetical protein G7078_00960 [Sphingomonas sinipercae]|uniref:Uncharacterized protein n=1 Tax=Sphingomonas sinipercae TaxID=2714944 RepID=A0A6G7ZKH5_9SPHN|nr:hypothetical protein [Sphingomonas sinipercae]QIL01497.1 hypothetical protein G7078_00960 [Sphingomonas sinipercae]
MDVEVENPHDHVAHRTGHQWLDKVLPISALFVSFISILIAWHHGQVMKELVHQNERLVQANSLPYLTTGFEADLSKPGERFATLRFSNDGIGPAEIRWAEYRLDGRPKDNMAAVLTACCNAPGKIRSLQSSLAGTMLRAGSDTTYFEIREIGATSAAVEKLIKTVQENRLVAKACYCSVFGECWTAATNIERPVPVHSCPIVRREEG